MFIILNDIIVKEHSKKLKDKFTCLAKFIDISSRRNMTFVVGLLLWVCVS